MAAVLYLTGCPSSTGPGGDPVRETADAYKTAHALALGKTVDVVTAGDEAVVNAALEAYEALSAEVKALLGAEKTLLESLKAKIDELKAGGGDPVREAADAYKTAHALALGKTVDTVTAGDEAVVNAALGAYEALSAEVKALLGAEKALLESLKAKIDELKGGGDPVREAADAFKTAHAVALGKLAATVTVGDDAAVTAALGAYEALGAEVKALLGAEKALLESLKARIDELKGPGSGKIFTIWPDEDGKLLSDIPASFVISKSNRETLTIEAAEGLTDIRWSLNGGDIPDPRGSARKITIEAVSYVPAPYTLGLYVKKGVVPYSITISFTVNN
jgi:DNA replication initiation complex subunit (GINS family)